MVCGSDFMNALGGRGDEVNESNEVDSQKWGNWSLRRTVLVGLGVVLVAAFFRILAWSFAGLESELFHVVDTIGFIALIIVASKRKGGLLAKVATWIVILIGGYLFGIAVWFGSLFLIGIAIGAAS